LVGCEPSPTSGEGGEERREAGGQNHPRGHPDSGGSSGGEPPTGAPPPRGGPPPTHGHQSTHSRRRATSATPLALDPQRAWSVGGPCSEPPTSPTGTEPLGFSVSAAASPQCAQGSQAASGQGRPRGAALPPNMFYTAVSFPALRGPWLASGPPATLSPRATPWAAFPRSQFTAGVLCAAGVSGKTKPPGVSAPGGEAFGAPIHAAGTTPQRVRLWIAGAGQFPGCAHTLVTLIIAAGDAFCKPQRRKNAEKTFTRGPKCG
jgi:hypothetical protein